MSSADTHTRRWWAVLTSSLCLLAATNGPAVTVAVRWFERPFSFEDWPFDLPIHAVAAVGIWRLARHRPALDWPASWNLLVVAALPAWMIVSNLIVDAPTISQQRLLVTVGVIVFGVSFGLETRHHQIVSVFVALSLAVLASAAMVVLKPDFGVSSFDQFGKGGYYQGIFANRNSLGPVCAGAIIAAYGVIRLGCSRWLNGVALLMTVIATWMLIGSRSATPLLGGAAAVALCGAIWAYQRWYRSRPRAVVFGFIAVAGVGVLLQRPVLSLVGRDSGLSDRTDIWSDVLDVASRKPMLGHGFWAFWDSDQAWSLYELQGGYQYGSAHNSAVEMVLGNGWIGGGLFVAVAAAALTRAVGAVRARDRTAFWWPALTAFVLVEHMTESFVLYHSYLLILLVAAASLPASNVTEQEPSDAEHGDHEPLSLRRNVQTVAGVHSP